MTKPGIGAGHRGASGTFTIFQKESRTAPGSGSFLTPTVPASPRGLGERFARVERSKAKMCAQRRVALLRYGMPLTARW
jgi:hypothetical protein